MTVSLVEIGQAGFLFGAPAEYGDEPVEGALIIRPSSWQGFQLCGYRVGLSFENGFDHTSSEAMAWGSGVHKLNANHIQYGYSADSADEALAVWIEEMRVKDENILDYASRGFLYGQAQEMLYAHKLWVTRFWEPVGQHLEVLAVEDTELRPLGVLPSDRHVWIRGTADFVTEGKVWDWKTAGRGWKRGKAESNLQHLIYSWLVGHITDVTEASYVVYNRTEQTWAWDDTTLDVTAAGIQVALLSMWDMAKQIDAGTFSASPHTRGGFGDGRGWHCSPKFCGAWSICPMKYLIADGKAGLIRETQKWD